MLFPTLTFGVFFLLVLSFARTLGQENARRKFFLLAASYVFYGWWDWRFCFLLLGSSVFNWAIGALVGRSQGVMRGLLVTLGVIFNLLVLGLFKYYGFFVENFGLLLNTIGWERDLLLMQIILPVGISFYTFQGISYVVDKARGDAPERTGLIDAMLYISFFPQLVAGPIVRAKDFLPQLFEAPRISREAMSLGILLILWGLFKKSVIATVLATELVDPVFAAPTEYGALDLLFGVYAYAVQIYCDFSAYSDIAIGAAALLGYRFNRNFDQPYRARSFQEFWRRWHISLSTWLRDYLYIPLGGSRGGEWSTRRNLMITMLLGGLWHGAAWTFIAWGAIHGMALVIERMAGLARSGRSLISLVITFHGVCLAWIMFRASDFGTALDYLQGLVRWNMSVDLLTPALLGTILLGLALNALPPRSIEGIARVFAYMRSPVAAITAAALFLLIDAMRPPGVAPFIYFQL